MKKAGSGYESRTNEVSKKWNVIFNILMVILSLIFLLPVLLVYSVSFTSEKDLMLYGYRFIPKHLDIGAYVFLFKTGEQLLRSTLVSAFVVITGTSLGLLIMSMFSYVLSRKDFKYRNHFSFFVFFTMLFNGGLVASYIINVNYLHINETIFALILPIAVGPFNLIILRTFFNAAIPDAIIESARIDGANEFKIFTSIVLPLSKTGLATIALFLVIGYWNDWYMALLYITKKELIPLQFMLMKIMNNLEFVRKSSGFLNSAQGAELARNIPTESGRMALVAIVMTPILLAFPFFQRYFTSGLTIGSIKG